jgi:2-methylisocitrate lyase-like PEP mutase family enzyme
MDHKSPRQVLRTLLAERELVVAPGAFGPMVARMVERHGFPAVYMTGAGTALARYGLPDVGLLTMTEMVDSAALICESVSIPVIADADTGYGNELNVRRTVRAFERAGVAAIHLEDQVTPKKCGHLLGKRLIPMAEMASKLHAAYDARTDPDFVLIARCDALAVEGMEAVRARGEAYVEAGADVVFVESPTSIEQIQAIPTMFNVPTLLNLASSGRTPYLKEAELARLGYGVVILPNYTMAAAIKAMNRVLATIKNTGNIELVLDQCATFEEMMDLAGLAEVKELEKRYRFPEEAYTAIETPTSG